jgi:urease subunit alpha
MATLSRRDYAAMYGPTTGDGFRLGDTSLVAVVEKDFAVYGDECLHGGGKTLRDGAGLAAGVTSAEGALDFLLCNVTVIDAVVGIVKGDLGIRDGKIVGIGKAGNPATMDGVDPRLIVSAATTVRDCEGLIATAGASTCTSISTAHSSASMQSPPASPPCSAARSGPITVGIDCGGPFNVGKMLQAAEHWPINFGFLGRGNSHRPASLVEQIETGCLGLKLHEDWGTMPASIDTCLTVADELDFPVQIHTDTLNESGFLEDTLAAINGRTIHMYHTEGAGGGHAPDIISVAGVPWCLPSSTNPTNPYTVNTFDEHLDMTMVCHHLNPAIPEDVAFAESRIRAQTIAAEDMLHDIGAISMLGSDSQGMGRINEVICRTWQLADKMKKQRGRLPEEATRFGDNERIKRYVAKYTINAARTFGIAITCRLAGRRQDGRHRHLAPGLLRHQAGARHQGRLHRLGRDGRQRCFADDLRAAAAASAMGRLRPGQAGTVGMLRQSARHRARTGRDARFEEGIAALTRQSHPVEEGHAAQRRLPEHPRRSADLRRLCRW